MRPSDTLPNDLRPDEIAGLCVLARCHLMLQVCVSWHAAMLQVCVSWHAAMLQVCVPWHAAMLQVCVSWHAAMLQVCVPWRAATWRAKALQWAFCRLAFITVRTALCEFCMLRAAKRALSYSSWLPVCPHVQWVHECVVLWS